MSLVPLEDVEEKGTAVISSTLVGKIICSKILNRNIVKSIIAKAWGEPDSLYISKLGLNTYMFNFIEEDIPKNEMDDSPWNVMDHFVKLTGVESMMLYFKIFF